MNRFSTLLLVLLWMALALLISPPGYTHELKETSAQITLRDGQVEMQLFVDVTAWLETLSDEQAWMLGDIDYLYAEPMSETETDAFLKKVIEAGTRVSLNGEVMALTLAHQSEVGDNLHARTLMVLQGRHNLSDVHELSVTFPKSLGPVYISVAKPHYQMVPGGQTAQVSLDQ